MSDRLIGSFRRIGCNGGVEAHGHPLSQGLPHVLRGWVKNVAFLKATECDSIREEKNPVQPCPQRFTQDSLNDCERAF
jgi:hypothetical protein